MTNWLNKMVIIHKNLASGRWQTLSLCEQFANIGSEVSRTIYWQEAGKTENMEKSALRVLELIDLTIADKRWKGRLFEVLRLREIFCDRFFGKNIYNTTSRKIKEYFLFFALAARKNQ